MMDARRPPGRHLRHRDQAFSRSSRATRAAVAMGRKRTEEERSRFRHPGTASRTPLLVAAYAASATAEDVIVPERRRRVAETPALSMKPVPVTPGATQVTVTPEPRSYSASASEN